MAAKKSAPQLEAEGVETVEFEWDGHTYAVPARLDQIDLDTLEEFLEGNALSFVRTMLGPDQWSELKARQKGKPHRFVELREAISGAMDQDMGESSDSSD